MQNKTNFYFNYLLYQLNNVFMHELLVIVNNYELKKKIFCKKNFLTLKFMDPTFINYHFNIS